MNKTSSKKGLSHSISRRQFVGRTLAAGGVITGAPAFLRGQNLNNKLNIAMIACGGRGNANMNGDGGGGGGGGGRGGRGGAPKEAPPPATPSVPRGIPAENITVLCDTNQDAIDAA